MKQALKHFCTFDTCFSVSSNLSELIPAMFATKPAHSDSPARVNQTLATPANPRPQEAFDTRSSEGMHIAIV